MTIEVTISLEYPNILQSLLWCVINLGKDPELQYSPNFWILVYSLLAIGDRFDQ